LARAQSDIIGPTLVVITCHRLHSPTLLASVHACSEGTVTLVSKPGYFEYVRVAAAVAFASFASYGAR